MKHFKAPWATSLRVISVFATLLCLALPIGSLAIHSMPRSVAIVYAILAIVLIGGAALFCVRGYVVRPDCLLVERLFWDTRLPLAGLESARFEPNALRWSIRTCGNGGFFSFTGWYWNKTLRTYKAFVTDPKRAVVLRFAGRTIVVSPDLPDDFIREISSHTGKS